MGSDFQWPYLAFSAYLEITMVHNTLLPLFLIYDKQMICNQGKSDPLQRFSIWMSPSITSNHNNTHLSTDIRKCEPSH